MKDDSTPLDPIKLALPKGGVAYLALRYSLEFVVVVLGITVSFWFNEWNEHQRELTYQAKDASDLLQDLRSDLSRLEVVAGDIEVGLEQTERIAEHCQLFQRGGMTYAHFADSLIQIGAPYSWRTFFMNDGTYKTLLNNGRLQNFPSEVEDAVKEYYEYVSKRVRDNNNIVDNVSLNYYLGHHPLCHQWGPREKKLAFMSIPGIQAKYKSIEFYTGTIGFRSRISAHGYQIKEYMSIRATADSLLSAFLINHPTPVKENTNQRH